MSTMDRINQTLETYDKNNFDSSKFLEECRKILDEATSTGNELDPRNSANRADVCNTYGSVAEYFLSNGFSTAATSLLVEAWNKFAQIQYTENKRIYRAGIGFYLVKCYLSLGDTPAATRWALLTQADDLLGQHFTGAGKQLLETALGMPQTALTALAETGKRNYVLLKSGLLWSAAEGFAEDVLLRFALNYPQYAALYTRAPKQEYPLTPTYFHALRDKVESSQNNKQKGDALEDLASYLFLLLPGCLPKRNLLAEDQIFETDLLVRNGTPTGNFLAEMLGRHFIVECKNHSKTIGVADLGYFLYRMHLTHVNFGVLFSSKGITGKKNQKAAHTMRKSAYHEDNLICIVIENVDLDRLEHDQIEFGSLIQDKIEQVRFGKSR